jgi:hypothetical protein
MKLINELGLDILETPLVKRTLADFTAVFLADLFPRLTALFIEPSVLPHQIIDKARALGADLILQDQSTHCVNLTEPAFAQDYEIPFYYLSGDFAHFRNPTPGIIFFPYWLVQARQFPDNDLDFGSYTDINRKYFCSSICRHPRDHRVYNFLQLRKRHYTSQIFWTFYNCPHFVFPIENVYDCNDQEWNSFLEYYQQAPQIEGWGEYECISNTKWDAFVNSYFNLVSETYTTHQFASEKSYKPFLSGQIPVIYGAPGANRVLADIGFDMFYDIVNHHLYDDHAHVTDRIDQIWVELDRLSNLNMIEIFQATADRRRKNKEYFFSQELLTYLLEPLHKAMKEID